MGKTLPARTPQHRDHPYDPNPTLVDNPSPTQQPASSPVPLVAFNTPEARANVVGPLRERYDNAVAFATTEWDQARNCQTDIDGWGQEIDDAQRLIQEAQERIKDRQDKIQARELDKKQHMLRGEQARDVANPTAVFLAMAGDNAPQITAPVIEPAPRLVRAADLKVHPLDTSTPLGAAQDPSQGSFPETKPDGYCIQCGEVAWSTAVSEITPKGARHAFGATCKPEDPNSTVADLGDMSAERAAS